jgi:hypothetical protein
MDFQQEAAAAGRNMNEMQRTGSHETDLLQMYETSILYDCTFKVGSENARGGCKVRYLHFNLWLDIAVHNYAYICNLFNLKLRYHKNILAMASSAFEATFCGNFKEAKMDPDEAIELEDITPETFDCAMR